MTAEHALATRADARAVVLVEGISDRVALETLAERRGRDLAGEGVVVVPIGGAQAIGRYLNLYGPRGLGLAVAGLCDAGEEREYRRGLERAGLGSQLTRSDLEALGFYVCEADLEEELIRALGADVVERVVEANGDLRSFRTLQKQPDVARTAGRRAAPPLHGQRRPPQDPVRAPARRGARPRARAASARRRPAPRVTTRRADAKIAGQNVDFPAGHPSSMRNAGTTDDERSER